MSRFHPPESLKGLIQYNVALVLGIFVLLEIWRPCYFLTDDNLDAGLPFFTEMGRHLKAGASPFVSDYLFGGNYDYLRDVQYFCWHPIYFLASLLADTPARFAIIDLIALFFIVLTTIGFVRLAWFLRGEFQPSLSNLRLTFYTLSFVYSTYILTTSASWANTLGDQSALPWLALGILERRWKMSIGLIALFALHQLLGGQLAFTISNLLFLSVFAVGIAIQRKSWQPLIGWAAGNGVAIIMASPFLIPAMQGFFDSNRSGSLLTAETLGKYAMPVATAPFSLFVGNFSKLYEYGTNPHFDGMLEFPGNSALLACAAAWCLIPALLSRARWRYLEVLCLGLTLIALVLVVRPTVISEVMLQIPVLRSMRWPFREILQLLFFFHLFLILRPQIGTQRLQDGIALGSLFLFLAPLPISSVPTLNPLEADRQALFSGQAGRFWERVKREQLKPGDQMVSVVAAKLMRESAGDLAFSLMGTANFPAYFQVPSLSGYSQTAPRNQLPLKIVPTLSFGSFGTPQIPALLEAAPHVKIIVVQSTDPLIITLYEQGKPPVDLTPYLAP